MSKILISTEGGVVRSICTDIPGLEIVIVDYDKNADYPNDVMVSEILNPDAVADHMYTLVNPEENQQERAVYEALRVLNF